MANLLSIPFKKAYPIEIKQATRAYLSNQGGAHPDQFKEDIKSWQDLRRDGVGGVVHENRVGDSLLYHAQLISILTKLPTDMQLAISYAPAFTPSSIPVTLNNLVFERACLLFNLAALYSQLGSAQDRSNNDGIKGAAANYQQAAGTLLYLHSVVLPKLTYSPSDEEIALDLSTDFVKGLEWLMLAQAQECSWQMAKLNQYKNSVIAKIASTAASLYRSASSAFRNAPSEIRALLPSDWIPHIETKEHHFSSVAEYRESLVEYEARRYGNELGRLAKAHIEAKQAYDVGRRGKVASTVLQDAQSLLETVKKSEARAQRDNDLIYHQDVPSPSALPPIQEAKLVNSTIPKGLQNPSGILGTRHQLFSNLAGWGSREAISIYKDRKQNLIKDQIFDVAQELQDQIDEELRRLNLPSALEALERPIGLPPSLLRKAEEVRLEDGPAKIEASIEDVQRLARQDLAILEEALDILDTEASEDEAARKEVPLNRLKSYEANVELIEKSKRYRSILTQAAESDETVRQKWDEWEENICELTLDEEILEAAIPSSTISSAAQTTPQGQVTRTHARALRVKLEELDTLRQDRDQILHRAQTLADGDDIQGRIMQAAAGFERMAEVTPDMFEDILDEELAKYDRFIVEMKEIRRKQDEMITEIKNLNTQFLDSRKDDPSVKEREIALQSLDMAYSKYREITRNLEEGFQFYNDLAAILIQFKEVCKAWCHHRNQEIHAFTRAMQSMSIKDDKPPEEVSSAKPKPTPTMKKAPVVQNTSTRKAPLGKSSLGLPAINSSEWDFEELPLPPGPGERSHDSSSSSSSNSSSNSDSSHKNYKKMDMPGVPPRFPEANREHAGAPPPYAGNPAPPPSGYRLPLTTSAAFPDHYQTGQPPFYDADGTSPIFIGSALFEKSVHPCKIGPHLQPFASVPYGGGEHGHHGRYDLLPFRPDQMEFVHTSHGRIPPGRRPVEGGYEEGGERLYHAVGMVNGVKVPGKAGEHLNGCRLAFGGVEYSLEDNYEIL
ncbi:pH-response regulator protein palA/RIM20 [Psilocybe cubensis]|uniref:PH-response regulator protein palA/RIM20 n=1 Tax=Psilocybe cubensis TaxID=181762 RepID=A0ACB8H2D6_PSICU|nr:pH-response regulator protein palA/RIM20 [Psilocybe cubensis]KAH9481355.1 pH-response regulator protein palA/RIM20 [Psilocybe cubensis]